MQKPSILLAMPMDNQIYAEIEKNLIDYGFEVIVLIRDLIEQRQPYFGADFALFIRADMFSDELLAQIRPTIRQKMVCYQWDGINRFGNALDRAKWFDRFFVFNSDDLSLHPQLEPATNFYLDYSLDHRILVPFWDIYFTGSHLPNRTEKVIKFAHFLNETGGG
ncbi:hypothetical protein [Haemophilus paracuniculus]|uniref:hypothetical protein n=1 Tax=Haemophilus paracuniculus TaxID=734 RepID=UPI001B80C83F|nr:hypothetical protein [Haemophilus paracuniculus]